MRRPSALAIVTAGLVIPLFAHSAAAQPTITTQPASQTIASGTTASLSVIATGTAPLSYQWYLGTSGLTTNPVQGATGSSFTTPPLTSTTSYWVRVWNAGGTAYSTTATVTVAAAPAIATQPSSQTIAPGTTASLSVLATGTAPLSYQWYVGTSGTTTNPVAGATGTSYTTPALTSTSSYWVRVSNVVGHADSSVAKIAIAFTDDPLVAGTSLLRAVYITELRARIDAVRLRYGLGPFNYTNTSITPGTSAVMSSDLTGLRTALAQAYTAAGQMPPTYDTSPSPGGLIVVADIVEVRAAVVAIE